MDFRVSSLGCGAVTASVGYGRDHVVTWSDLGWQTDYDAHVEVAPYRGLGPYAFERASVDAMLRRLIQQK